MLLIVRIQAHLDAVQQVGNHLGVAADWDSLIQGIEIVVVKGQAHGQALDDEGGQIFAVAAPLLLGVALDLASSANLPHTRNTRFDRKSRSVMEFIFIPLIQCRWTGSC